MGKRAAQADVTEDNAGEIGAAVRRAFGSFLALPSGIIVAFLLLAAGTTAFDQAAFGFFVGPAL